MTASQEIDRLLAIMARLRSPQGCPWDREQTFRTIAPYTIEEAYEIADAIERDDMTALKDELGDLLFQVVFHARMAEERGEFAFSDVAKTISDKMERRHPHVFGDASFRTAEEQTEAWERQKAEERHSKGAASLLDDVPAALPGMTRAVKLQKRAARVGFDWPAAAPVLSKIKEEIDELLEASEGGDTDAIEDEFGDLLFVLANLSRHLRVDPESALRRTNEKFARRFRYIERRLAESGRDINAASLEEMEALWTQAKREEREPQ
ncbi:MAG TPA: nucleoside triphosphate pyrophosphohydrolase [Parvularculaceae bacterium]|nr:nucleoside triphosphate pyrophosphohydrolase [Parvularculaceae bacterium]